MQKFLEIRDERDYCEWRIARPDRLNGIGTTLAAELAGALAELKARPKLPTALVLTATPVVKGPRRTWLAGGDLKELQELKTGTEARRYAVALSDFLSGLDELPIPVVVAVDGAAIGGGAELALGGDVRLATSASSWEFKQLRVGLATGYGSARRLVELVGLGKAQGLLYRGATVSASEALNLGLVHQVVADEGALREACRTVSAEFALLGPETLAAQKRMFWHATHSHPGAARAAEAELFTKLWLNPAHARFLAAFNRPKS